MALTWQWEDQARQRGFLQIAGIDEVGRGPLAGPVVAAAVILPEGFTHPLLNDSKKLTALRRAQISEELCSDAKIIWALGEATVEEIDRVNILQATFLAMRRAVERLQRIPDFALVDGNQDPRLGLPVQTVVKGDSQSPSIAAASVIAKQHRDSWMDRQALVYPEYGFEKHKGYGTSYHLEKLRKHGPTPLHRRSFAPVLQCELALG